MIYNFCSFFQINCFKNFHIWESSSSCTNENVSEIVKPCTNWVVSLRSQFTIIQLMVEESYYFVYVYL